MIKLLAKINALGQTQMPARRPLNSEVLVNVAIKLKKIDKQTSDGRDK